MKIIEPAVTSLQLIENTGRGSGDSWSLVNATNLQTAGNGLGTTFDGGFADLALQNNGINPSYRIQRWPVGALNNFVAGQGLGFPFDMPWLIQAFVFSHVFNRQGALCLGLGLWQFDAAITDFRLNGVRKRAGLVLEHDGTNLIWYLVSCAGDGDGGVTSKNLGNPSVSVPYRVSLMFFPRGHQDAGIHLFINGTEINALNADIPREDYDNFASSSANFLVGAGVATTVINANRLGWRVHGLSVVPLNP